MRRIQIVLFVAFGLFLIQDSWASRAYVTDSFKITLRRGPSNDHLVIGALSSGDPVEVLESAGDWTRVRPLGAEGGQKDGWVLTRYLMNREPWQGKAEILSREVDSLRKEFAQVKEKLNESSGQVERLSTELKEKEGTLEQVQNDYDSLKRGASEYLDLKRDHDSTLSALETAKKTIQRLTRENQNLIASEKITWFGIGALVLFGGWLIGLFTGRLQRKARRRSSYEF